MVTNNPVKSPATEINGNRIPGDVKVHFEPKHTNELAGGIALFLYILVWVASLGALFSPIVFALSGCYISAVIAVAALVAWSMFVTPENVPISKVLVKWFVAQSPRYFNRLVITMDDEAAHVAEGPTIYVVSPHGCFCMGWGQLYANSSLFLKNAVFCFAEALYHSPFFRLVTCLTGRPGTVTKEYLQAKMKKGVNIGLCVGGFDEATISEIGHERIFIKNRAGFVRLALEAGYSLTPCYVFGEGNSYWNAPWFRSARLWLAGKKIPSIVSWGHPLIPILPRRGLNLYIAVGKPIALPKIEKPTREDVAKYHALYMEAVTDVFNRHKLAYCEFDAKKAEKLTLELF